MSATTIPTLSSADAARPGRLLRAGLALAALALLVAHSGDRGQAQSVAAGIDPLEVLNLLVRPNVLVVLDSSGSMAELTNNADISADHPEAKLLQAKEVLTTIIGENQDSISFQLAQYTQPATNVDHEDRWEYVADSATYPSLLTQTLFANVRLCISTGEPDDIEWSEDGTFLQIAIDNGTGKDWDSPDEMALDIQTRMNAHGSSVNDYTVTFDPQTQTFTFTKTAGSKNFVLELDDWDAGLGNDMGFRDGDDGGGGDNEPARTCAAAGGTGSCTSDFAAISCGDGANNLLIHRDIRENSTHPNGTVYYRMNTGKLHNGDLFYVLRDGKVCSTSTGTPDAATPFIEVQLKNSCADSSGTGDVIRFDFAGAHAQTWTTVSGDTTPTCGGQQTLVDLVPCTTNDQLSLMGPYLQKEVILSSATPVGYSENVDLTVNTQPTVAGIKADGSTPVAESLEDLKTQFTTLWNGTISAQVVKQTTYAIILTDGDDTCESDTGSLTDFPFAGATSTQIADARALRAAYRAELLYDRISVPDPESGVTTFIVAFGQGASAARANWIAWGGSGLSQATTDSGDAQRWSAVPSDADRLACSTCRDAFYATDKDALAAALRTALSEVLSAGSFSTSANTLGTVFELGHVANDPDCVAFGAANPNGDPICAEALNPNSRYNNRVNVLYQSVMELPGFKGHLFAFANIPGSGLVQMGYFDAGLALDDKVNTESLEQTDLGRGTNLFTFAELHGGATTRDLTAALIPRRIFTSSPTPPSGDGACTGTAGYNCTYVRTSSDLDDWDSGVAQGSNVVALWPPDQTDLNSGVTSVDPAVGTAGPFDDILGMGAGSSNVLSYAELQALFGACVASVDGGAAPADCDESVDAALALATARKEARQIVLAYTAGARRVTGGTDGLVLRDASTSELLFRSRDWILLDSTLSQPAVSSPPLRNTPNDHIKEFLLFRDGRRGADRQGINEISSGFGLRNPDFDDTNPEAKTDLKPVMTVVYVGANDGVHAFRGGPNCGDPDYVNQCDQIGLEELWNFVPFDQLAKLTDLATNGQAQDPHTYVIATSPRLADIFIEETFTLGGVSYEGRWRTVLVFGRGPGGKFYTMLDVTAPGPFTIRATDTHPPFVMWNHGNQDGVVDLYDGMGQTWSTPAIGFLGGSSTPEWALWTGSGYGETGSEGKTFYMLNAVDGSILYDLSVGNGDNTYVTNNALVAPPTLYNSFQLDPPGSPTRTEDKVTRVYIPDLHGRIWKFDASSGGILASQGPTQPFGNAVALLSLDSGNGRRPQVFLESGNDSRVPTGLSPGFSMYGIEDPASSSDYTDDSGTINFTQEFGSTFRGTLQPATAFNSEGNGRVFFVGTRFNPPGVNCLSSFDSILYALGALSGDAVYDFNGDNSADMSTLVTGTRITGIQTQGGELIMGGSGGLGASPQASVNTPTAPTPSAPTPASVMTTSFSVGGNVCTY